MKFSHNFEADPTHGFETSEIDAEQIARSLDEAAQKRDERGDTSQPSSPHWNSHPDTDKWLASNHQDTTDSTPGFLIDGWLAKCGTSVWFGAGSTGKTQLMLWMAAMLASHTKDRIDDTWLGGKIYGSGHILILTAEDTRDHIMNRLQGVIKHSMGQDPEALKRTCSRIHIMPFLSMTEAEFKHPNPSLFQQNLKDRNWETSAVLNEVRRYISEWNRIHDAEDRIIGVIMDSATSMAGFDSLDAQATTNFFFYLGRLCEKLQIFWAIIGHTPKATTIARGSYRETAPNRLRGVAMWTTAPRLTVEVRLVQDWRERGKQLREAADIRDWLGARVERRDLLVVYVAKANLLGATRQERYLARVKRGAFVDVTDKPDEMLWSGVLDKNTDNTAGSEPVEAESAGAAHDVAPISTAGMVTTKQIGPGRKKLDPDRFAAGTDLVFELIREIYVNTKADRHLSANHLMGVLSGRRAEEPRAALVLTASGGGKKPARNGSIGWHLEQLEMRGLLRRSGRRYFLVPVSSEAPPEQ